MASDRLHLALQVTPEECRKVGLVSLRVIAKMVGENTGCITCTNMKIMASVERKTNKQNPTPNKNKKINPTIINKVSNYVLW